MKSKSGVERMKKIIVLMTFLVLSSVQPALAGNGHGNSHGHSHNGHGHKVGHLVQSVINLISPKRKPKAGQIITWNGHRWVPSHYARYQNPGNGAHTGEQMIWDGHHWVAHHPNNGGNSVKITAGYGLLANGQAGAVINEEGTLEVDVGNDPGQIPFINDDGDLAIQGFFVTGTGVIFPDGTVQTTAATGIQGPAGPQGPAGADGAVGPQGPAGLDGAMGPMGPQGPAGPAGADGAVGPQGPAGPAGPAGAIGPQGPAGPAGAIGPQGPAGVAGPVGPQGPAGPAGADGAVGPQGPAGVAGPVGPQGPAGPAGAMGPMGPQGPAGADGVAGPVGPQGPAGAMGPMGPQGPVGPQGEVGPQGPAGSDATVSITAGVGILGDGGGSTISSTGSIAVNVGTGAGQIPQIGSDGKLPESILPASSGGSAAKIAYVRDVKPSGTNGGSCTAGAWHTRDLNSVDGDSGVVSGVSSNTITLAPGKYEIEAEIPAFLSSQHKTRLVDATLGTTLLVGTTGFANGGTATLTHSLIKGLLNIPIATTIKVEHRCGQGHTFGFGYASGFGEVEIYSQIKITKLD